MKHEDSVYLLQTVTTKTNKEYTFNKNNFKNWKVIQEAERENKRFTLGFITN